MSPLRVRYTGIVERTEAFRSRHIHATSISSLNREFMLNDGVDHSAGHPSHGDGITTGNDRASTGLPSTVTPRALPAWKLVVVPAWFGRLVNQDDQNAIGLPHTIFGLYGRFAATQCASVTATSGEMSTSDVRRDHSHASP